MVMPASLKPLMAQQPTSTMSLSHQCRLKEPPDAGAAMSGHAPFGQEEESTGSLEERVDHKPDDAPLDVLRANLIRHNIYHRVLERLA